MSRLPVGVTCVAAALATLGVVSPRTAVAGSRVPGHARASVPAERSDARGLIGVIRVAGRPTRDVVIWLDVPGARPEPARPTALLDQRNMQFVPRVLAVRVGTTVRMPNSDRLLHNVFSFRDAKVFDLGLYPVGTTKTVTFDRPGVSRIFCNIHPNMAAYVLALDSPSFAVSDADGRFSLEDVPEGSYTYHVWHTGKERSTGTLRIAAGQLLEVDVP